MKQLKPLEQHNMEKSRSFFESIVSKPRPNGLACPDCGNELNDSSPDVTLTSNPPQKRVACSACSYRGLRYV